MNGHFLELEIRVERDEVYRALGYPVQGPPRGRPIARLGELWDETVALLRPRGAFRLVDRAVAAAAGVPEPPSRVALGLCTIGPELENEALRRSRSDAVLDALLIDAIGSAAAEATADRLNLEICATAHELGRHAGSRISPGYGRWDVTSQPRLLELLPAAALGVELTPGLMMQPRKSVSFAVPLRHEHVPEPDRCARCGLQTCRHRVGAAPRTLVEERSLP